MSENDFLDSKAQALGYHDAFDYFCFGDPGMFNHQVAQWIAEFAKVHDRPTISESEIEKEADKYYPRISSSYQVFLLGARVWLMKLGLYLKDKKLDN